ncbi:MAG: ECF transporter S component [Thermotaleaceae bacterium]
MNYSMVSVVILTSSLVGAFLFYEKKRGSVKEISVIATLAALAGVSRVPFAALPNIQPTTFLVILSGTIFGPAYGFLVGAIATLVSNSFLGHGPWTPWQMLAWGLAGWSAGFLKRMVQHPSRLLLASFAFCWGFLFDYIMNLWHWLFFVYPLNLKSFMAVYAASFYFDLMHGLGNFAFTYMLGKDFMNILSRFKERLYYSEIPYEKLD